MSILMNMQEVRALSKLADYIEESTGSPHHLLTTQEVDLKGGRSAILVIVDRHLVSDAQRYLIGLLGDVWTTEYQDDEGLVKVAEVKL